MSPPTAVTVPPDPGAGLGAVLDDHDGPAAPTALELEPDASFVEASGEELGLLDGADLIVVSDTSFYDAALPNDLDVLATNPRWATLRAVRAGRVVQVKGPVYNGGSYQAASALLTALGPALSA